MSHADNPRRSLASFQAARESPLWTVVLYCNRGGAAWCAGAAGARHIVKENPRLVDLKHHATAFYGVADECKTFKEISALLKLAMDKSRTLQGSSKPGPSANSANADDSSLAASDTRVQRGGSKRNAAHAASKSKGKSKDAVAAEALLKSRNLLLTADY